jgi:hypothetical protein
MKRSLLLTMLASLFTIAAYAQLKVQTDGHISLGTLSGEWNVGTQVYPSGCVHFNHPGTEDWQWITMASPNSMKGKCWIVNRPGNKYDHRFFVTGDGYLYKRGSWKIADARLFSSQEGIRGAGSLIDQIKGVWYIPADEEGSKRKENRRVGIVAQELESVLPEAVTTDENGQMYIDYESLTVFLIEALKEQRQETELLRKALEEHGLVEPKK